MKITIEIDATPQEVRDFCGLPDVQQLQNDILQKIRGDMKKGVTGVDAFSLMKPILPAHLQTMESIQNAFWTAFAGSKSANSQEEQHQEGQEQDKPSET